MDFLLFLVVNAVLFLRPAELVPALLGLPLYLVAIVGCIVCSLVPLMRLVTVSPLFKHPTVLLTYAMLPIVFLSLMVNKEPAEVVDETYEFAKILTYFTLFLALVSTPGRLRAIVTVAALCVTVSSILGVAHFQGYIVVPALESLGETVIDEQTLEWVQLRRLRFTGMLQDPNEVAVFLSVLTFLGAAQWQYRVYGPIRHLWLVPLAVFLACIGFTQSRGGLLALMVGIVTFSGYRYGGRKAVAFSAVMLAAALVVFAGRQTDFSSGATSGTGQSRIGLWSDWMEVFRGQPILGAGPKVTPIITAPPGTAGGPTTPSIASLSSTGIKHVAHNSFLQAFADLGFAGGLAFLGAAMFAAITLHRYRAGQTTILDPEQRRLHPYLMAALASYLTGMQTLVLNYVITTAFVLALPLTYYAMTPCYPPVRRPDLGPSNLVRLTAAGIGYLALIYVTIRLFRNY